MRKKSEKICLFAVYFAQQKRQLHDQHGNPAGKVGIRQRLNAKMHFKDERCGGKHADSHSFPTRRSSDLNNAVTDDFLIFDKAEHKFSCK